MNELKPEDVMKALELYVQRYLMPNVDIDGTVQVGDAERWFLKLLKEQLVPYVTALLREKDAEIERLQGALKAEERHNELTMECAKKALANARAEAITEFAERLKACFDTYPDNEEAHALYVRSIVDQIADEMKGATDGKTDL